MCMFHPHSTFRGHIGIGSYVGPYSELSAYIGRFCSIAPFVRSNSGRHPYKEPFVTTSPCFFSLNPFKRFLFQEISPRAGTLMLHKSIAGKYKFPEQMRRNEDVKYIFDVLKNEKVFSSSRYVMLYNQNTLAASGSLNDIKKDYLGYLPHYSTDKWESVAYYNLYKQAYRNYLNEANNLYPGNVFETPSTKLRSRILYIILLIRRIIDKFLFTIHL